MSGDRPKTQAGKDRIKKDAAKKARLAKSLRQNLAKRKRQTQIRNESPLNNTKTS